MTHAIVTPVLVDATNFSVFEPLIIGKLRVAALAGVDLETHDAGRHEGLNQFMKTDAEGFKAGNRPLVFDVNRTVICGISLYADQDTVSYYLNLNHADVENRLTWEQVKPILDALAEKGCYIAHNSMFEKVMLLKSLGYVFQRPVICTMQMAVSAHGPDEYAPLDFRQLPLGPVRALVGDAAVTFLNFTDRNNMTGAQGDLFNKFCGKESKAAFSYNGWTKEISRPYGLKQAIKYWFGVEMQTFEETLDGEVHMGKLTGAQAAGYGADDAVWAVRLYHKLLAYMMETNPAVIPAFFRQELPCIDYYADVWAKGMLINSDAVTAKRVEERGTYAQTLRAMKKAIRLLLPFPADPHEGLMKYDSKWYAKGAAKYRSTISAWALSPDIADDFLETQRIRGAISCAWAADLGKPEPLGLSIAHYMPARTMLYDLMRQKVIIEKGKVQSDGECRGKMKDRLEAQLKEAEASYSPPSVKEAELNLIRASLELLTGMGELASIEQRAKLYLNPYTQLIDPDTSRVYPIISSKLASRRTSIQHPNGQQLAKRGDSTYIRGFYQPDYEDHVILSCDWSSIELVLIGEFSGDPEFKKAFGQLPYQDLHLGATASCLSVVWGAELTQNVEKQWSHFERYGITNAALGSTTSMMEWFLKNLKGMTEEDIRRGHPGLLVNIKGEVMNPAKALKYWRTEVGKAANFGYWYSGALSDVGRRLGWSSDQMWKAVEAYRARFAVAELWRTDLIRSVQENGFVQLPDGHRRYRYEATPFWYQDFSNKFMAWNHDQGVKKFVNAAAKAIQTRANNQAVNSKIQGSCATLMKRSILRLMEAKKANGWTDRDARLLIPIHDELLVSVHKELVVPVIAEVKKAMCFADIVTNLPLTVAPAIGRTFEPFIEGNRNTQIELAELSPLDCFSKDRWGQEATDDEVRAVVDWIFTKEKRIAA